MFELLFAIRAALELGLARQNPRRAAIVGSKRKLSSSEDSGSDSLAEGDTDSGSS